MAAPPPSTSRFFKPSASVSITVFPPVFPSEKVADTVIAGKFVSESKFSADPAAFIPHILKPNRQALEALITKPEVERKLLLRLRKKASTYAQDFNPDGDAIANSHVNGTAKIDVDGVVELYENYIIPLTKEVEVH